MARETAIISQGTRVKGRITGSGNLEIDGRVDGEVHIDGDVTITAHGLVSANVVAHTITVRGAVKGDLVGSEAVRLEDGARVVGDLRAPRIAIAPGGLVRGYVQTGDAAKAGNTAQRPATSTRITSAARPVAPPVRVAPPPPKAIAKPAESSRKVEPKRAAAKAPPPPVVPALKKGAKGALKKKA